MKYNRGMNPKSRNGWIETGPQATTSPNLLDIAWAAGIFEGEGHIQFGTTKQITMTQCDKWVIDRFVALFGGRVYITPPRGLAKKKAYRWYAGGQRMRGILQTWYTFLSPRLQARILEVIY